MSAELATRIKAAYTAYQANPDTPIDPTVEQAISTALDGLSEGRWRVASQDASGNWITHAWLKQAILLSFRLSSNRVIDQGYTQYYDKVPLKYCQQSEARLREQSVRIVPPATVRHASYVGRQVVLMPCYVNIGAYIDDGCMIDTWATVGSCAQIGRHVHLSGGAGIGGVLEPLQASPTIIEDNCFIGARSEIVEGVIVEQHSVIGMGVFIGQSTPIYDRANDTILYGRVPAGSVVISGSLPSNCGKYNKRCAIIVKQVDEQTRGKTAINELLRDTA